MASLEVATFFVLLIPIPLAIHFIVVFYYKPSRSRLQFSLAGGTAPLALCALSIPLHCLGFWLLVSGPLDVMDSKLIHAPFILIGYLLAAVLGHVLFIDVLFYVRNPSVVQYLQDRWRSKCIRFQVAVVLLVVQFCINTLALTIAGIVVSRLLLAVNLNWLVVLVLGGASTTICLASGLAGLLWADVYCFLVTIGSLCTFVYFAHSNSDLFDTHWTQLFQNHFETSARKLSIDPRSPFSHWSTVIGSLICGLFLLFLFPSSAQRFCAVKSARQGKHTNLASVLVISFLVLFCTLTSCLVLMIFFCNSPFVSQQISAEALLLRIFSSSFVAKSPGLSGLAAATLALLCLSFSTSQLHSAGIVVAQEIQALTQKDNLRFVASWKDVSLKIHGRVTNVKIAALLFGLLSTMASCILIKAYSSERIVSLSLPVLKCAIVSAAGTISGLFLVGVLVPFVNRYGALASFYFGLGCGLCLSLGHLALDIKDLNSYGHRSWSNCAAVSNIEQSNTNLSCLRVWKLLPDRKAQILFSPSAPTDRRLIDSLSPSIIPTRTSTTEPTNLKSVIKTDPGRQTTESNAGSYGEAESLEDLSATDPHDADEYRHFMDTLSNWTLTTPEARSNNWLWSDSEVPLPYSLPPPLPRVYQHPVDYTACTYNTTEADGSETLTPFSFQFQNKHFFLTPDVHAWLSFLVTILTAILVSILTGGSNIYALDWNLIHSWCHNFPELPSSDCYQSCRKQSTSKQWSSTNLFRRQRSTSQPSSRAAAFPDTVYRNPRVQQLQRESRI